MQQNKIIHHDKEAIILALCYVAFICTAIQCAELFITIMSLDPSLEPSEDRNNSQPCTSSQGTSIFRDQLGMHHHMEGENSQPSNFCNRQLPHDQFTIIYYNCRSLLPKYDELLAVCQTFSPDVLCLVEIWLCKDIKDR